MKRDGTKVGTASPAHAATRSATDLAIDPVCGQVVDPTTVTTQRHHQGTTYHFCCHGCRALFDARPDAYHAGRGHTPHW